MPEAGVPRLLPLLICLALLAPSSRKVTVKEARYRLEICTLPEPRCPWLETPRPAVGRWRELTTIFMLQFAGPGGQPRFGSEHALCCPGVLGINQ